MILVTMLLLAAPTAPTVAAIKHLSPLAAGNAALAGKDHGPIAQIVVPAVGPLQAPGVVELHMVERATATAGGCVRKRWTVSFRGAGGAPDDATLSYAYAVTEVALRKSVACPRDAYVKVALDLEPGAALAALAHYDDIRRRRVKVTFSCSDSTRSNLCRSPRSLHNGLARVSPWLVKRESGITSLWLGPRAREYGQAVTEVSYSASAPATINVTRRTPAPA